MGRGKESGSERREKRGRERREEGREEDGKGRKWKKM